MVELNEPEWTFNQQTSCCFKVSWSGFGKRWRLQSPQNFYEVWIIYLAIIASQINLTSYDAVTAQS